MDVIHARGSRATPEVLEEAKALRDKLREEKHAAAAAATSSAADAALRDAMEARTLDPNPNNPTPNPTPETNPAPYP